MASSARRTGDGTAARGGIVLVQVNHLELGGTQINAVDLAAGVRELGFDSVLVGPADSRPDGPSLFDVARDRGVRIETVERPRTTVQGARDLAAVAQRHRADLVHVYGSWSIRPAFWGACLLARRPLVMTVYEMRVDPVVYRSAHLVVGTGYLVDDEADRPGPVTLISPPVDVTLDRPDVDATAFCRTHGLDPHHRRVVIVSRLDGASIRPVKTTAVEAAIGAVEALDRELGGTLDVVVVGGGLDEARLRGLGDAANARLGRRAVVFTGPLADPRPAYASADVVLGMGGSAARGLAFGKALVVTGEYGTAATFTPARAAAIFRTSFWSEAPVTDPVAELLAELRPLLTDPAWRAELGRFGRDFAVERFGLEAMARRLAEVYTRSLREYRRRDWARDLALEGRWAGSWVGRRLPENRLSARARAWSDGVTHRTGGPVEASAQHRDETR